MTSFGPPPSAANAPDPLYERVRARLERERGPLAWLRARPTGLRALGVLLALLAVAVVVLALARRPDLAGHPVLETGGRLGLFALGAAGAVLLFLRPLFRRPLARGRVLGAALAGILLPALVLSLWPAAVDAHRYPETVGGTGAALVPSAWGCFATGLLLSLPVWLLLLAFDRREGLSFRRWLLVGAAGGLAGNLALSLHCPLTAPAHLLLGHATVPMGVLVLALAFPRPARSLRRGSPRGRLGVD